MSSHISVETRGSARIVTVCRASKKNALAKQTVEELVLAIKDASVDETVRGIVLAAEGDVYMAGGDLGEFATILDDPHGPDQVIAMGEEIQSMESCDVPIIAAVSGDVFGGGCELVLCCDDVIAEAHVGFSFRHARMGLSPAWGGASRLLERVGPLHASRLILTAERVGAEEAVDIGLATRLVPSGTALEEACSLIERIAHHDRRVIAMNKRALQRARAVQRGPLAKIEADAFKALWGQAPHRAAMSTLTRRRS